MSTFFFLLIFFRFVFLFTEYAPFVEACSPSVVLVRDDGSVSVPYLSMLYMETLFRGISLIHCILSGFSMVYLTKQNNARK